MKRVAVIGAGLTGTVAALSLADAGVDVDLYERSAAPLFGASAMNEGKIHLGYVYAMDSSQKTAHTMLRGAASFRTILERWVNSSLFERYVSEPFTYAVPHSTMLDLNAIRRHFSEVSQQAKRLGPKTMMAHRTGLREHCSSELESTFDPRYVAASFETEEVAIDPLVIRRALIGAIDATTKINLRCSAEVISIRESGTGYSVHSQDGNEVSTGRYDAVVNATWHQRLKLDATFGIRVSKPAIHRYKCGLRTTDPLVAKGIPSVTFIVGEYGDSVAYGNGAFLSWYPSGLVSQEIALSPAIEDVRLSTDQKDEMVQSTLHNLHNLMPAVSGLLSHTSAKWEVVGGYISAWGNTGIDHADSELHDRYDIGVNSEEGYHSVDTGKYSLAPLFGTEAAARVIG